MAGKRRRAPRRRGADLMRALMAGPQDQNLAGVRVSSDLLEAIFREAQSNGETASSWVRGVLAERVAFPPEGS